MTETALHDILELGVQEGASDWHIREDCTVSLRVNGTLGEIDFVTDNAFFQRVLDEVVPANLLITFDKTGDADFAFEEDGVGRFRANLHRQRGKLGLTLRFVKEKVPPVGELHLPEQVPNLAESLRGIIFVAGITGAGKSTTLACMVEHMNQKMTRHIITVEDPIEYAFQDDNSIIEQREVGLDVNTFNSALIHVLRQDPDVIVIGEMRDRETFETALVAAETGHLVLTTLHTMNASQSLTRILDMYDHNEREAVRKGLAINLRAIVCQRLVRRASGRGMVPAMEILINTPIVTKLISENKLDKIQTAIDAGAEDGMMSFNRSLLGLINEGLITEEEGLLASSSADQLRMNLQGIFLNSDGGTIVGQ